MTFHVWASWSNLRRSCLWCPQCYSHLNPALQCQPKVGVGRVHIHVAQRGRNSGTGTMRCMTTNSIWNLSVYNVSFVISLRRCTPAKCAQRHLKRRKGRLQAWKCHLELPKKHEWTLWFYSALPKDHFMLLALVGFWRVTFWCTLNQS